MCPEVYCLDDSRICQVGNYHSSRCWPSPTSAYLLYSHDSSRSLFLYPRSGFPEPEPEWGLRLTRVWGQRKGKSIEQWWVFAGISFKCLCREPWAWVKPESTHIEQKESSAGHGLRDVLGGKDKPSMCLMWAVYSVSRGPDALDWWWGPR